tara:strand:- start:3461 stop:4477 length:1017 start_codon:yes stop_codon:yes gene_type:complete
MKILITGGLGYIGSHTAVELSKNYKTIIVDNLINSDISVLKGINNISYSKITFYKLDLMNKNEVKDLFNKHSDIKGIIHFAALKSVSESVNDPLSYYQNNIFSIINLLNEIKERKMKVNFIFSSSCTVYGESDILPIKESNQIKKAKSPYGNTKQVCEEIISDFSKIFKDFSSISLRYFNPIGAHISAEIGELPLGVPQNLVPYITQSVAGIRDKLTIFGNDYETPDGTCIRDYIHVVDLARAHIFALKYLEKNDKIINEFFNIGTGRGISVLDIVKTFEKVTGQKVNYAIGSRRYGDVASAYADNSKAIKKLNWKPKFSIDEALISAWQWEKKLRGI